MTQPQAYNRETDFTERDGDDTNHAGINTELDAAALSINELRDNLALIQRDDGALKNGIVTAESLSDSAFNAVLGEVATATAAASASADRSTLFATQAEADRIAAQAAAAAAQSSQTAAATSATAAANSQTAAANSATSASTSASTATTKASEASTSASNAATSATSAATSASTATTKASEAATSATNAANSATTATTQAGIATTQASNAAASATAASASFDEFDDRYLGSKTVDPTTDNDGNALLTGALYFNSVAGEMRVWAGTFWKATGSSVGGTINTAKYTATAGQTTFAIVYDVGFVHVYLNGVKLESGAEFTANNGSSVVLATGATAGDVVDMIAFGIFSVANTYTKAELNAPTGSSLVGVQQSGTGAVQRTAQDKMRETVSVKDFGAVGDGVTNDTAAFNAALNYLRGTAYGGCLKIPMGEYAVTSINATDFSFGLDRHITIRGSNNHASRIIGTQDDVAVLDCAGANNIHLDEIWIGTKLGTYAQTGLLLCRTTTSTQCNGNVFTNVWVQGDFKKAAVISIGAESSTWYSPRFRNPYPIAFPYKHCTFYTADRNGIGASSLYKALYAGPSISPNTDNAMFKPHFFAEYLDNVDNVVIEGAGQWSFYSPLLLCKGEVNNNMVTYVASSTDNVFKGRITWYSPLIEGPSYTAHKLVGYSGVGVEARFDGIKQIGGYNNNWFFSSYALVQGVGGIGLPYNLTDCEFSNISHNPGNGAIAYADVITRGKYDGHDLRVFMPSSGYTQGIDFGLTTADSNFGSQSFGTPIQTAGTAAPTTGYHPKNAIHWNENPAQGGYIGWVCTAAGNPGTWRGFGLINYDSTITGSAQARSVSNTSVANNGTVDLSVAPFGNGYQGFLVVTNTLNATANQRTHTTYSVFGRGTDSLFTQIATDTGVLGGVSFTVSTPSDGVIRVTNTSGATTSVYVQFFGGQSA